MNLRKIIAELMKAGLTQGEIAESIGVKQATVSRYADGEIQTCEFSIGSALLELHRQHVPRQTARP